MAPGSSAEADVGRCLCRNVILVMQPPSHRVCLILSRCSTDLQSEVLWSRCSTDFQSGCSGAGLYVGILPSWMWRNAGFIVRINCLSSLWMGRMYVLYGYTLPQVWPTWGQSTDLPVHSVPSKRCEHEGIPLRVGWNAWGEPGYPR